MKLMTKFAAIFCSTIAPMLMVHQFAAASEFVGVRQIAAPSKERGGDLAVTLWYPADEGGNPSRLVKVHFLWVRMQCLKPRSHAENIR